MVEPSAKKERGKEAEPTPAKKVESKFGIGFYVLLVCGIIKDISDVLLDMTIIFSWVTSFTGAIMTMAIWIYLFISGVPMNSRKLATIAISSIIDLVPLLSILPTTTLGLVAIRVMDWAESKLKEIQTPMGELQAKK